MRRSDAVSTAPTPLREMVRLGESLRGPGRMPRLFVKRDDLTGLGMGGNKARKLSYLIQQAVDEGYEAVVTGGALQSNHCRQTAAAARIAGLECTLLLTPGSVSSSSYRESGNVLFDSLLAPQIRMLDEEVTDLDDRIVSVAAELSAGGVRTFPIPVGGSNPVGSLGYVDCARELDECFDGEDFSVVLATGSGGTQAGLVVGSAISRSKFPVLGYSVSRAAGQITETVREIAAGAALLLGCVPPSPAAVTVDERFIGPGYGVPTTEMVEAVALLARTEGIFLDPVYTGKAFAGMLADLTASDRFEGVKNLVFLHTGGQAAMFAYPDLWAPREC